MPATRTARDRVRDEVTKEILVVARAHLARDGAAALSLRSIARDLEMAPSALYRYFDGRDALLSALILEAYTALADAAEKAADAAQKSGGTESERWYAVPRAMRKWAQARPHEWGLIFGSPVPGYQAPEETTVPYARLAGALVRPVADALHSGRLRVGEHAAEPSAALERALAPVRDALLPEATTTTVLRALQAWSTLIGVISLELFGHFNKAVLDTELFFEETVRDAGRSTGLRR
jgi:AcrR family transcriptional regulator